MQSEINNIKVKKVLTNKICYFKSTVKKEDVHQLKSVLDKKSLFIIWMCTKVEISLLYCININWLPIKFQKIFQHFKFWFQTINLSPYNFNREMKYLVLQINAIGQTIAQIFRGASMLMLLINTPNDFNFIKKDNLFLLNKLGNHHVHKTHIDISETLIKFNVFYSGRQYLK